MQGPFQACLTAHGDRCKLWKQFDFYEKENNNEKEEVTEFSRCEVSEGECAQLERLVCRSVLNLYLRVCSIMSECFKEHAENTGTCHTQFP